LGIGVLGAGVLGVGAGVLGAGEGTAGIDPADPSAEPADPSAEPADPSADPADPSAGPAGFGVDVPGTCPEEPAEGVLDVGVSLGEDPPAGGFAILSWPGRTPSLDGASCVPAVCVSAGAEVTG
jgi:hypothetical protein